ncbi:sortase [Candidatus Gracilibacteria bacterium]|nr:sortase [Candidatus Gracilibacteria bacterium]
MKKAICIFLLLLSTSISHSYKTDYVQLLAQKGVNIISGASVDTSFPEWFKPGYSEDIASWLRVLPFPGDRNEETYVVLPKLGVISPIQKPADHVTHKNFNYNKLLESGVALYPNRDGELGSWGNSVIFGHSSYFKSRPGRYKTIFSVLPLLNKGDQIWLYKKELGKYRLYKYHVLHSYETHPYDGFVTKSSSRKIMTLFTCTDIGTRDKRWLIKAEQMQGDTYVPHNHVKKIMKTNVTTSTIKKKSSREVPVITNRKIPPSSVRGTHSINQEFLDSIFDTLE